MPWVDLSSERVDEIVLDKKGIPGVDKVDRDVVPDLEVTVRSEEPLEGAVDGVMEGNGIETVEWGLSKEILVVVGSEVYRSAEVWSLIWRSSTSAEEGGLWVQVGVL